MPCQLASRAKNGFGHVLFTSVNTGRKFPSLATFHSENLGSGHTTAKNHFVLQSYLVASLEEIC